MLQFQINPFYNSKNEVDLSFGEIENALGVAEQIITLFKQGKEASVEFGELAELIGVGNAANGKVFSLQKSRFCLKISELGKHVGPKQEQQFKLNDQCREAIAGRRIMIEKKYYHLASIPTVAVAVDGEHAYTLMIRHDKTFKLWDEENIPFQDKDNWPVLRKIKNIMRNYGGEDFVDAMDVNGNNILVDVENRLLYLIDPYVPDLDYAKVGHIYWYEPRAGIPHPQVVLEVDGPKVTMCQITTNMRKASFPGNILLDLGEGNLEKRSIIEVSKQKTIKQSDLGEHIGQLSDARIREITAGQKFIQTSFLHHG